MKCTVLTKITVLQRVPISYRRVIAGYINWKLFLRRLTVIRKDQETVDLPSFLCDPYFVSIGNGHNRATENIVTITSPLDADNIIMITNLPDDMSLILRLVQITISFSCIAFDDNFFVEYSFLVV